MSDRHESTPRWQFSLRTLLGVTTLFSLCCACVVYRETWLWLPFLACLLYSACWGSALALRRPAERHEWLVGRTLRGGAVGAAIVFCIIGFGLGVSRYSSGTYRFDRGIEAVLQRCIAFGVCGLFLGGLVGIVYGMCAESAKKQTAKREEMAQRDRDFAKWLDSL